MMNRKAQRRRLNHTIMEIVISPLAKGDGYASSTHYTHSSDLKTMQEIFQVGPLLGDAGTAGTNDLADMFLPGTIPSTIWPTGDYNHSGTIDAADYAVWRKGLGTTYTPSDYTRWAAASAWPPAAAQVRAKTPPSQSQQPRRS